MQYVMNVNTYGAWRVTKAFAPLVIADNVRIVTIGSISGILSSAMLGVDEALAKARPKPAAADILR